jgi:hypothetical protein
MADPVESAIDLAWLAALGIIAYLGWKLYDYFQTDTAANQALTNPGQSIGTILGFGQGTTRTTTGQMVAGTLMKDSGNNVYRCSGGKCYPIDVDSNGNETVSGVPETQTDDFTPIDTSGIAKPLGCSLIGGVFTC